MVLGQEPPQERLLAPAEGFDGHPTVGPRDHGIPRDGDEVEQRVPLGAPDAGIGEWSASSVTQ
jgi:hypothetical protein